VTKINKEDQTAQGKGKEDRRCKDQELCRKLRSITLDFFGGESWIGDMMELGEQLEAFG